MRRSTAAAVVPERVDDECGAAARQRRIGKVPDRPETDIDEVDHGTSVPAWPAQESIQLVADRAADYETEDGRHRERYWLAPGVDAPAHQEDDERSRQPCGEPGPATNTERRAPVEPQDEPDVPDHMALVGRTDRPQYPRLGGLVGANHTKRDEDALGDRPISSGGSRQRRIQRRDNPPFLHEMHCVANGMARSRARMIGS